MNHSIHSGMKLDPQSILKKCNLRDTQPRRLVLKALMHMNKPASHKEIHVWIQSQDAAVNLVTVYRTLETFEERGVIHRHPSSGNIMLCSMSEEAGHHGFLSCESCGKVEEFCDKDLCSQENRIAKKAGFTPKHHVSEIIGVCSTCQ